MHKLLTTSVLAEIMDDGPQPRGRNLESCERDRQLETSPSCASGIQEEHATNRFDFRDVRMAGDDDVDPERTRIDPHGFEIVQNIDRPLGELHGFGS